MTKLEKKLIELGYEEQRIYWRKDMNNGVPIQLHVFKTIEKIMGCLDFNMRNISEQWHIDNLQQAFNQLQKDLEVLKEYE